MDADHAEQPRSQEHAATPPPVTPPPLPGNGSSPDEDIGDPHLVGDGGLKDKVVEVLKTVFDPEIPFDIHALGLIYGVKISDEGHCRVTMTLTSPNCPAAVSLPGEVEVKVRAIPGITGVELSLVWDPPWGPERMSEEVRLAMGL